MLGESAVEEQEQEKEYLVESKASKASNSSSKNSNGDLKQAGRRLEKNPEEVLNPLPRRRLRPARALV